MSRTCPVTNKKTQIGGGYSNKTRATEFNPTGKRGRKVNLQTKRFFIPELGITKRLRLSTRAIKTINKNGAYKVLKDAGLL
jgi:large subunit ribosomal protein L28